MNCRVLVGLLVGLFSACVQPDKGQEAATACEADTCPVGTSREERRSIESWEVDVSDGRGPDGRESGGTGVAFLSKGDCSFTCVAQTECPSGTWPVITSECFTCALLDDAGQVIESECDFDDDAATGTGTGGDTDDVPEDVEPTRPGWEQVASGAEHTCARFTGGMVTCWGASEAPPDTLYTTIDAGRAGTCGLTSSGMVLCWGVTGSGSGSPEEQALLSGVPDGAFTALSVGDALACVLDPVGSVTCWGSAAIEIPGSYATITAGGAHACAGSDAGVLDCFGDDSRAQVRGTPAGSFETVSAGAWHTCARTSEGALTCWSLDDDGESTPPPDTWQAVSVGDGFTCGVDDDDAIQCWGRDTAGQTSPPDARAVMVSAGAEHACAALWDGTVACWGADTRGQSTPP